MKKRYNKKKEKKIHIMKIPFTSVEEAHAFLGDGTAVTTILAKSKCKIDIRTLTAEAPADSLALNLYSRSRVNLRATGAALAKRLRIVRGILTHRDS